MSIIEYLHAKNPLKTDKVLERFPTLSHTQQLWGVFYAVRPKVREPPPPPREKERAERGGGGEAVVFYPLGAVCVKTIYYIVYTHISTFCIRGGTVFFRGQPWRSAVYLHGRNSSSFLNQQAGPEGPAEAGMWFYVAETGIFCYMVGADSHVASSCGCEGPADSIWS